MSTYAAPLRASFIAAEPGWTCWSVNIYLHAQGSTRGEGTSHADWESSLGECYGHIVAWTFDRQGVVRPVVGTSPHDLFPRVYEPQTRASKDGDTHLRDADLQEAIMRDPAHFARGGGKRIDQIALRCPPRIESAQKRVDLRREYDWAARAAAEAMKRARA